MSEVLRLDPHRSALLIIDMQKRLMPVILEKTACTRRAARLAQGAKLLNLPRLVTEQYSKGLGSTVDEVAQHLEHDDVTCYEDKTRFSACVGRVASMLDTLGVRSVILAGVETHVCVLHTALDLLEREFIVAVCEDATSSRRAVDKHAAMQRMIQAGVIPTTVESALLELCEDAATERFKVIRDVIRSKTTD